MSNEPENARNIFAGAAAGAAGGLVGGLVKAYCEKIAPPRPAGRAAPPAILAERVTEAVADARLTDDQKQETSNVVHYVFSVTSGAFYGALVEVWPGAKSAMGTAFGVFVWAAFHEIALPLLGATPSLPDLPASEQSNEFITHAIFGATVEAVRSAIRR